MVPNNGGELRGHGSMTGVAYAECAPRPATIQTVAGIGPCLSVSNSSSGRRWKLDHAPAVGDPTHMVEFGTGRRAFAREA